MSNNTGDNTNNKIQRLRERLKCKGDGECLMRCFCECYMCCVCNQYAENCLCLPVECECPEPFCDCSGNFVMADICVCSHREHGGWCKPNNVDVCEYNCEPVLCQNDRFHPIDMQNKKYPKWYITEYSGNCRECTNIYGYGFRHIDVVEECPVCYDNKDMVELHCKHKVCRECWWAISTRLNQRCPLCRSMKRKEKVD
jgi:hypothetical protein